MNNAEVLIKFKADSKDLDKATSSAQTSLGKLATSFTIGNLAAKGISKGIEIFASNVDDAVSRIDTMNNFSKVMKNLGISVEDSDEVIKNLSNELVGLPTTLNSAASSVQRLTSYNGDIKKSEDYFLAMNNAIIAGTNDAGMQATAMEQLTQAYTKGKPDMQDWKTLLQAMPAQLKQVAIAMGYPQTEQLYEALNDFMDTMVKLNTTGTNGFASFEQQARSNTEGIKTSVANMKTAFVRGIADMIKQVDTALKSFGGLSGVLQKIGKYGEQTFKKIGSILGKVLPKIINFAKWIKEHKVIMALLVGVIAKVVTLLTVYKTIMTVINTIQAIQNALLLANPAVLIIAAIVAAVVGLIATITYLWNHCETFRNFITGWFNGFKMMLNGIISAIKTAVNFVIGVITTVIDFFKNNWQTILLFIVNPFAGAFKLLYDKCEWFRNIVNTVINSVKGFFTGLWTSMKNGAVAAWNSVKSVFSTVASFFRNIFTNAWNAVKNVFSTGGKIFTGIKEGILNGFKTIVNGIIGGINKVVKIPFDGIKTALDKIRNVSIAGQKPFKGLIPSIKVPQIPKLNVGTNIVPDDMLAMIHKGEAVVPKKFNPYANGISNSTLGATNNSRGNQVINVYASFKQDNLGQVVRDIKTFSGGARNDFNYGM